MSSGTNRGVRKGSDRRRDQSFYERFPRTGTTSVQTRMEVHVSHVSVSVHFLLTYGKVLSRLGIGFFSP